MKNTLLLIYILFVQLNYAQNCERTFNTLHFYDISKTIDF